MKMMIRLMFPATVWSSFIEAGDGPDYHGGPPALVYHRSSESGTKILLT